MDKVAILVNEFGDVGLDHLLVETISEDIILLQSGCICCQVKDDLVTTLMDLFDKLKSGEIEAFNRVLIETTGVADPVPVVQVLISDPLLCSRFRLDGVVTLVDAVFGRAQLEKHDESIKQVALADRLILTKSDLVNQAKITALTDQLKQLNPSSPIAMVIKGDIHPKELFSRHTEERQRNVLKWLNQESHGEHNHLRPQNKHCDGISSVSISLDEPIDWEPFSEWLDSLIFSRAENILRIKGILNLSQNINPLVIQGVQNMFYPPSALPDWPTDDRRSHLVFITYNFNPQIIERSLRDFLGATSTEIVDRSVENV